ASPARELPLGEDLRQQRCHGYPARPFLLRVLFKLVARVVAAEHLEAPERPQRRVVVLPAQRRGLTKPRAAEESERVEDPTVLRDPRIEHELLDLRGREDRRISPPRRFVLLRRKVCPAKHARRAADQFLD